MALPPVPPELILPGTILLGYRGSVAHGTWLDPDSPDSVDDIDLMGVVIPGMDHYFGLEHFGNKGTKEITQGPWDVVYYELKKFVSLLEKGNPNVLSLLWLNPQHRLIEPIMGSGLRANRSLFATKSVYPAFVGYAHGQLKRMTHFHFEGYLGEKRRKLVEHWGYDTKNASHLIRLLRMGIEFLKTGELLVERPDARELVEIKTGKWTLERVQAEAERLFTESQVALEQSPLPEQPDRSKINQLLRQILFQHFQLNTQEVL